MRRFWLSNSATQSGESSTGRCLMPDKKKKRNWIDDAIQKPGALRNTLGVKEGENIPASKLAKAAKQGGKTGQRARLAQTLRGMGGRGKGK